MGFRTFRLVSMASSSSRVALNTAIWLMIITTLSFLSEEAEAVPASDRVTSLPIQPTSVRLVVDGSERMATVGDEFICATLDWWPATKCDYGSCPWYNVSVLNLDLTNPILEQAVKALAPLKVRLGGTLEDVIEYDIGPLLKPCLPLVRNSSDQFGFSGGCLPIQRWDLLNQFFKRTGASVAFGLNTLYGRPSNGSWDPSNAAELIQYTHDQGYPVTAWELGNELMGDGAGQLQLSPQLYADNVKILRTIVNRIYVEDDDKPLVVAPDSYYQVADPSYQNFLAASGPNVVDVVTRHMYNLGPGSTSTEELVENILNQGYATAEDARYVGLQTLLEDYPWATAWVGEAGGAFNSGHENVTDAFIMAFWYLDQLGLASKYNNQAFCRQSLIGGHYGLLDAISYVPNPDFYGICFKGRFSSTQPFKTTLSRNFSGFTLEPVKGSAYAWALLWHELMGNGVLSVNSSSTDIRAYAHCQKNSTKGGVTLLLLNYSNETSYSVNVSVLGQSNISEAAHAKQELGAQQTFMVSMDSLDPAPQLEFHMSPEGGDIHSHVVLLNGNPLRLTDEGELPPLEGLAVNASTPITVYPETYTFVVLEGCSALACLPHS